MTDDEIEVVAAELAKAGGVSWHSEQERGPLKLVQDRFRDRARLAIAALDRARAAKQDISADPSEKCETQARPTLEVVSDDVVSAGSLVLFRPTGDQRSYPCRVEKVDGSRVYLNPEIPTCTGWVDLERLSSPAIQ